MVSGAAHSTGAILRIITQQDSASERATSNVQWSVLGYRQNTGSSADFAHGMVMAIFDFRPTSEIPSTVANTDVNIFDGILFKAGPSSAPADLRN